MGSGVYQIDYIDISFFGIYLILFFLIAAVIRSFKIHDEVYKRFFLAGFLIKIAGGFLFVMVFIYFYGFGDTFLYFKGSTYLTDALREDPATYFRLLASENDNLPPDLNYYAQVIPYSRTREEWFMVKLLSPLNFIGFRSYLVMTLFSSIVAFFGSWKLLQVFVDVFPSKKRLCFVIVFLLPSTLFWGTGILKDTFSMAAINLLIYSVYFMFFKGQYTTWNWIFAFIGIFFLLKIKLYILLSFLPAMALGIYYNFKNRINSTMISFVMRPVLILVLGGSAYFISLNLGEVNEKYAVEGLEKTAKGFHTWHVTTAGSAYTLGEIDYSTTGVLKKIPAALNVTFFRPYVWESRNPIMLVGAMESMLLLLLVIYTTWLWGFKIFRAIGRSPLLVTLLVFILIFGFAVGFTSYNFGALARYKIPISSLVFFVFFYLIDVKKKLDLENKVDNRKVSPQSSAPEKNVI